MLRRDVLGLGVSIVLAAKLKPAAAQAFADFDRELNALQPDELLATAAAREIQFRQVVTVESQGVSRRLKSDHPISNRARDLIVRFEVSSEAYYREKLVRPIWPKGDSGITVGIGYDIGYMSVKTLKDDWKDILEPASLSMLIPAAGKKGIAAKDILPNFAGVRIEWGQALEQFQNFLPFIVAETETAFPGTDAMNPDCRGALVSLVYNRGSAVSNTVRRREMLHIREHIAAKAFEKIPQEIRDMKKHWEGKGLPGLIQRRELEAVLFERGLEAS